MDFSKVIPILIKEFNKANINHALIGGFAMGALGVVRATQDIDFLVEAGGLDKVTAIMKKYGYRCVYQSENASQYVSGIKLYGEVDFIHAFRPVSLAMLKRAKRVAVFESKHTIRVACPEDIIGLKVQAMANDAGRKTQECADIERIMAHFCSRLNWRLLEKYFVLFDMKKYYKELKLRYGKAGQ